MAELNVQPKKKKSILPWILLLLGVAALIWWLANRNKDDNNVASTSTDTVATTTHTDDIKTTATDDWNGVDFSAPALNYQEVTGQNINVRGNANYGIYGLGENILFDEGKATIKSDAEKNLKEIVSSIGKRYNGGQVRVYGYTDSTGSAGANKDLAQQRADAVKMWLQNNGIDAGRISVNAIGEAQPVATNSTEKGRQQNRRVEIVARAGNESK